MSGNPGQFLYFLFSTIHFIFISSYFKFTSYLFRSSVLLSIIVSYASERSAWSIWYSSSRRIYLPSSLPLPWSSFLFLWLEFGRQRCRILIIQKGSRRKLPIDKLNQLSEGPLELGVTPELVIYGNSKGLELETRETMSRGRIVTLSRRLQAMTSDTSLNQDYQ